jgi:hypothetical protein
MLRWNKSISYFQCGQSCYPYHWKVVLSLVYTCCAREQHTRTYLAKARVLSTYCYWLVPSMCYFLWPDYAQTPYRRARVAQSLKWLATEWITVLVKVRDYSLHHPIQTGLVVYPVLHLQDMVSFSMDKAAWKRGR